MKMDCEIVKEFVAIVKELQLHKNGDKKSWNEFTAVKFMMARSSISAELLLCLKAHEVMRRREGLIRFDPTSDALRSELETGKFTILPVRDASGAAIAIFTAHKHVPLKHLIRSLFRVLFINWILETQRHGIVFIYNMTGSKYANFDYELSQKMLNLLKQTEEAAVQKLFMVNVSQLTSHIPTSSLPEELVAPSKWITRHGCNTASSPPSTAAWKRSQTPLPQ
ncbi:tyrosine-protein phosphatase non-receptor type 9 [Caerostris extrusa]|uniref:Tyrosine-protein phosphatase non-receptor type 9 n=1 Tax=Caerostris extrusa TaxID=172846 RepID=A0AAV4N8J5_CAEEX|nr:tyrosine-protein phosphatase non-receptor type 9 [Caerostris extrusa]